MAGPILTQYASEDRMVGATGYYGWDRDRILRLPGGWKSDGLWRRGRRDLTSCTMMVAFMLLSVSFVRDENGQYGRRVGYKVGPDPPR